jgi:hypothetical protein
MKDFNLKNKVLEEIMGLMDEKEGDLLKSHPKLVKAEVEVVKPKSEEVKPLGEGEELELGEKKPVLESEDEEIDDEMLAALMEKLGQLKD